MDEWPHRPLKYLSHFFVHDLANIYTEGTTHCNLSKPLGERVTRRNHDPPLPGPLFYPRSQRRCGRRSDLQKLCFSFDPHTMAATLQGRSGCHGYSSRLSWQPEESAISWTQEGRGDNVRRKGEITKRRRHTVWNCTHGNDGSRVNVRKLKSLSFPLKNKPGARIRNYQRHRVTIGRSCLLKTMK